MTFYFPSLASVVRGAVNTFIRFPFPILSSVCGTGITIFMLELKWEEQKHYEFLWKIVMCASLGLTFFLALTLISEKKNHPPVLKYFLQVLALVLLSGYYFSLPEFRKMNLENGTQLALFSIGFHLLVSFSPFTSKGEINGFWQFNKSLFLRFLTAVLYSGVLYIGLSLALLAVDNLFPLNIKGERYGQLWFFLSGVFNTWFFLAGVPKNLNTLETVTDYPKGLKIFTQFVLLPLVSIYLLILYAYGIKILVQWELPKGWVSWLVNAFSVFGILSLLLIWPIRNEEGNKWINIFSHWFYLALFPLIVLLGIAIGKRVMQYGITENRYFVLMVALWLTGIAFYFLFSKTKNIKLIPVSLFFIAFLSSFGPWGAFSVSEKSQVNRLEKLLTEVGVLIDEKIRKLPENDTIPYEKGKQIASIIRYLDEHHGFESINPWFSVNLDSLLAPGDSDEYVYETGIIMNELGIQDIYYDYYRYEEEDNEGNTVQVKNFYYYPSYDRQNGISVEGFDYCINYNQYFYEDEQQSNHYDPYRFFRIGKDSVHLEYIRSENRFVFFKNKKEILKFQIDDFLKDLRQSQVQKKHQYDYSVAPEKMIFGTQNDSVKIRFHFTNISGTIRGTQTRISNFNAMLLVKFSAPDDTLLSR